MIKYYKDENVQMQVQYMGEDMCVHIFGGDRPHIGSIAIAEPRKSLLGDGNNSSTVSVFNFCGHKDDEVAVPVAKEVSSSLGCRCVVICGIHYENLQEGQLQLVKEMQQRIVRDIVHNFPMNR